MAQGYYTIHYFLVIIYVGGIICPWLRIGLPCLNLVYKEAKVDSEKELSLKAASLIKLIVTNMIRVLYAVLSLL